MTSARIEVPAKGTRPRNRRELIREAAAVLFAERGYGQVSLGDVAAAVNVGHSALYRHYPGKPELLYDAVDSALVRIATSLPETEGADLADLVQTMAASILDNRMVGVLWQRESRNLPRPLRDALRKKLSLLNHWLATELEGRRPDLEPGQAELLAACAVDAATSVSFHHLTLPAPAFQALIAELCMRCLRLEPGDPEAKEARHRRSRAGSRADALIDASIRLFAEHGYTAVSIDDIGAAVGIAGPSVYKHFDSKQDLLVAALDRGHTRLRQEFASATAESGSDEEVLRRVTSAYVSFTLHYSDQIATLIGETINLQEPHRNRVRATQRAFIDDWVNLLRAYRPNDSPVVARIKVQAAQMVANDISRTPHLRKVPGFRRTVHEVCWALQQ